MSCKHCSGPCDQGRKPCPAPDACELRNDDDLELLGRIVLAIIGALATALVALLVA